MKFVRLVGRCLRFLGRWLRRGALTLLWLALMGIVVALAGSWWTVKHLQLDPSELPVLTNPEQTPLPGPIRIYTADGKLVGSTARQRRTIVSGKDMASSVREATVAIEDQRFYEHRGVDVQALARAAWIDYRTGDYRQGASTLTMQYIRNAYLDQRKTTRRKLREVALALQLESVWTKDRILTAYLNTVYYGNGAYGVEAASQEYFREPADRLSVRQAALLAGITNDPSAYDPRTRPAAAWRRARIILDEMFVQGKISRRERDRAKRRPPKIRSSVVRQQIFDRQLWDIGLEEARARVGARAWAAGNLDISLTIRSGDQRATRRILRNVYRGTPPPRPVIASTFVEPATGRILAMASSAGGYFDYARQSRRQPGSTVKLFTAAAYFRGGGQAVDPIDNSPLRVVDGRHKYTVEPTGAAATVGDALRLSQNPAFWRLYQRTGPARVLALERRLGLRGMDDNPAAALGGVRYGVSTVEMAGAAAGFANDGSYRAPHVVSSVKQRGRQVYADSDVAPSRAIEAEYARQLNQAARRVVSDGLTELRSSVGYARTRQIAGKTGTTEDNGDAWFVGYAPNLAGAVWTGYPRTRQSLRNVGGVSGEVFGATVPARTWNTVAGRFFPRLPVRRFTNPEGLVRIPNAIGRSKDDAAKAFDAQRLSNVEFVPVFDPAVTADNVLSVKPKPGTLVKPGTRVRVRYQQSSRPTPDLTGKSYLRVYETLGRYVTIEPKIIPSTEPTGTILDQYPLPGQAIGAGGTLQLTLATRRAPARIITKRVPYVPSESELARLRRRLAAAESATKRERAVKTVPDIVGLTPLDAGQVLASLDLVLAGGSKGRIIAQSPEPGLSASTGTTVTVTTDR